MLTVKQKKFLIEMGAKAPSDGNMQPWRINFEGDTMKLQIDQTRSSGMLDVKNYASILALGSFYENIYQAALSLGYIARVDKDYKNELLPIFKIKFEEVKKNTKKYSLVKHIDERVTSRSIFDGKLLSIRNLEKIEKNVAKFKIIKLKTIADPLKKAKLSQILGEGDRIRMLNNVLFSQMMSELRWSKNEVKATATGIDVETLEMPGNMSKIMRLLSDNFHFLSKINEKVFDNNALFLIKASSHIGCIIYSGPLNSDSFFKAGQALERMWLISTKYNIKIHPWSVLSFFFLRNKILKGEGFSQKEIKDLRRLEIDFREVFDLKIDETPIFIFRMFSSKTFGKKSLRLDFSDVSSI